MQLKSMRNKVCYVLIALWVACAVPQSVAGDALPAEHTFGAIADCQYCDGNSRGDRMYALSKQKLADCVAEFNTMPTRTLSRTWVILLSVILRTSMC